jgi:hypothetical protein
LEIKRYWPHPVNNFPTVLFYLNRYGSLLGHIVVIWEIVYTPSTFDSKASAVSAGPLPEFIFLTFVVSDVCVLKQFIGDVVNAAVS